MPELKSIVMDQAAVMRALKRMAFEMVEHNRGGENIALVGIQRRGLPLAEILAENIARSEGVQVEVGRLDITLYRDDMAVSPDPVIKRADTGIAITGRHIVLVDDVLYTGRTVRAAIDALISGGRPASVQLAILCDRGHRELPIRADYIGKNIPTSHTEQVRVRIPPFDGTTQVELWEG